MVVHLFHLFFHTSFSHPPSKSPAEQEMKGIFKSLASYQEDAKIKSKIQLQIQTKKKTKKKNKQTKTEKNNKLETFCQCLAQETGNFNCWFNKPPLPFHLPVIDSFSDEFSMSTGGWIGHEGFEEGSEGVVDGGVRFDGELEGPLGGVPVVAERGPKPASIRFLEDEFRFRVGWKARRVDGTRPA